MESAFATYQADAVDSLGTSICDRINSDLTKYLPGLTTKLTRFTHFKEKVELKMKIEDQ